ncbi:MAG: hypothetical protein QG559_448 [Campylobacterota bacterium]|nr:hypothetical protein [Campylobacterota bacterium]
MGYLMQLTFKLKHYFFNAFRELFVHHHGSLEFRAKLYALLLATYTTVEDEYYDIVKNIGIKIYANDEDRAKLLVLSTKELVNKIQNNELSIDQLITSIQKELKIVPRYAKKMDIESLAQLVGLSHDNDTTAYQKSIIEFLAKTREEILHEKEEQIAKDEEKIYSKYKN